MPVSTLLSRPRALCALALLLALASGALDARAQGPELAPCAERPTAIGSELYADDMRWCVESVVHDRRIEPLSFTALEVAPDGTLFATRPLSGAVVAIRDTDGDHLPDAIETFADGLTMPNGLTYHDGYLYVAGGANIYRISPTGAVDTIVDDLPSGTGFWTGGLAIGNGERLYVALGAPCSSCEYEDRERGAIHSMNLDGSERQIVATGFRRPADVAFYRDQLWTVDSAPYEPGRHARDELNRVAPGGWYGFLYCLGAGESHIADADVDCADSVSPVMLFGSGAVPISLAAFPHDALAGTKDTLIVVLSGEPRQIDFVGYKVIMITFDEENQPLGATILIPYRYNRLRQAYEPYRGEGLYWERFILVSESGFGIYPQQPLAVAVDPRGWIYISLTGGRIVALRPRQNLATPAHRYPVWTPMNPNFDPSAAPDSFEDEN